MGGKGIAREEFSSIHEQTIGFQTLVGLMDSYFRRNDNGKKKVQ